MRLLRVAVAYGIATTVVADVVSDAVSVASGLFLAVLAPPTRIQQASWDENTMAIRYMLHLVAVLIMLSSKLISTSPSPSTPYHHSKQHYHHHRFHRLYTNKIKRGKKRITRLFRV